MSDRQNWARSYEYTAERILTPESVEQAQAQVAQSRKVRALGSRHSFNDIADTPGDIISMANLNSMVELKPDDRTITVQGGIRYGDLCTLLHERGFALKNLASLPHISVAGACATATHGSGVRNQNLACAVRAMQIIAADGSLLNISRESHPDWFAAAPVGLGAFGIVSQVTLDIVPTFEVQQSVYEGLPIAALDEQFDEIMSSAYSVSLFTDWSEDSIQQVWFKKREDLDGQFTLEPEFFGMKPATDHRHPIGALSPVNCTPQMNQPGPWYDRLPHFRLEFTPSAGDELQSEYFVPRRHAASAIRAVSAMGAQISPLLQISEVRTIAADNLWLSPCFECDMIAIHFTWKREPEVVRALLPSLESALSPFGVVPHWGKVFTLSREAIAERYPRKTEFRTKVKEIDPEGKFWNAYLDRVIG